MTPAAGPELDDIDRPLGGGHVRCQSTIRLHEEERRLDVSRIQALAQRGEISADDANDVSVDDCGRGTLVLLDLGQHLVGDADRKGRRFALDDLLDHQLMRRIGERIDEADGDRLHLLRQQSLDLSCGIGRIKLAFDAAFGIDALVDDAAQITLHQRRRLLPGNVIEPRHAQRADLEYVAKSLGRDQPDLGALVLEDGVGSDCRAVANLAKGRSCNFVVLEDLTEPFDNSASIVVDAGGDLLGVDCPIGSEHDDVCERAADIDADTIGGATGHAGYSAARRGGCGSCHCTLGTSRQPRPWRMSARRRSVAAASTDQVLVSTTTP